MPAPIFTFLQRAEIDDGGIPERWSRRLLCFLLFKDFLGEISVCLIVRNYLLYFMVFFIFRLSELFFFLHDDGEVTVVSGGVQPVDEGGFSSAAMDEAGVADF